MAGKRTVTEEIFLSRINALYNNEYELISYEGSKKPATLRHIPCGTEITKRADSWSRAGCDICRRTNPRNIAEALEKRKATNLERFGAEFVMKSEEGKNRFKESIERSGGKDAFKQRIIDSNLKKYGVEWATQAQEIKNKGLQSRGFDGKTFICDKQGLQEIIASFPYKPKVEEILPFTGYADPSCLYIYIKKFELQDLVSMNDHTSMPERQIINFLLETKSDLIIEQSNRTILGDNLEIDIWLPENQIGIEYCGLYWHSSKYKKINYHKEKMERANEKGIRLIQIFENEWLEKPEIVKRKLLSILHLQQQKSIYARSCEIREISTIEARNFININHIQGYHTSSIKLGCFYENELVAVMTFRKNKEVWDLDRYCSAHHVIGGAGKLLKYFIVNWHPLVIETFADLRWSSLKSNIYNSLGFEFVHVTPPDYSYIDSQRKLIHRRNFQKAQIKKKYPEKYNDNMTEKEMMESLGFLRIYDCGKAKYRMTF